MILNFSPLRKSINKNTINNQNNLIMGVGNIEHISYSLNIHKFLT